MAARHAIYFAPAEGTALAACRRWLAEPDGSLATDSIDPALHARITATVPRRYGFPRHLESAPSIWPRGCGEDDLSAALADFATVRPKFPPRRRWPCATWTDSWPSCCQRTGARRERELAQACVESLRRLSGALEREGDLARRRAAGLTPRQDANLLRWGYPYVDRRFPVPHDPDRTAERQRSCLRRSGRFSKRRLPAAVTAQSRWALDAISLFREDEPRQAASRPCRALSPWVG